MNTIVFRPVCLSLYAGILLNYHIPANTMSSSMATVEWEWGGKESIK